MVAPMSAVENISASVSSSSSSSQANARRAAAEAAVALVEPGMTVGLGTGDTAAYAIKALAARRLSGLRCVATSTRSAVLAKELGLPLFELDDLLPDPSGAPPIAITIDGADEIDSRLQLSKGGGGALLFEKLVAQASHQMVVIADEQKVVHTIGDKRPLAIEVVGFGARHTLARILGLSAVASATIRVSPSTGEPIRTDSGNFIVDAQLRLERSPTAAQRFHEELKLLLGVVETGLFCHHAALAFIGQSDGSVKRLSREH